MLPARGLLAAFLAAFLVALTKDVLFPKLLERAINALATGICAIGGAMLLLNQRLAVRVLGALLPFAPTAVLRASLVREQQLAKGLSDFLKTGRLGAVGLVGVFVRALAIVGVGLFLPRHRTR